MTDEFVREAERALAEHGAFEPIEGEFAVTTTPFDAAVRLSPAGAAVFYRVTVRAPTLDAAVRGEAVAPVLEEGWFETLERRLEGADGAVRADPEPPTAELDADAGEVVVETGFESSVAARAAEDAKALVGYVEGTYLEGVIPGYDYREPVAGLLERAYGNAGADGGGPPL